MRGRGLRGRKGKVRKGERDGLEGREGNEGGGGVVLSRRYIMRVGFMLFCTLFVMAMGICTSALLLNTAPPITTLYAFFFLSPISAQILKIEISVISTRFAIIAPPDNVSPTRHARPR